MTVLLPEPFCGGFDARGWAPHDHQIAMLDADAAEGGLIGTCC